MTYPILLLAVALAGKPVAIPSDAEPSTRLAASELTNYLYRITGKVSEVKVGGEGEQWNSSSVVVGTLKTLKAVPAAAKAVLAKTEDIEAAWKDAFEVPGDLLRRMRDKLPFPAAQYHPLVIGEPRR